MKNRFCLLALLVLLPAVPALAATPDFRLERLVARRDWTGLEKALPGLDPSAQLKNGQSLLLWAVSQQQLPLVKALLGRGAATETTGPAGETALMLAARQGRTDLVHLLLGAGAQIGARDHEGYTVLMYAADAGHLATVQQLLKAGADPLVKTHRGRTLLIHAAFWGQTELVKLCLARKLPLHERDREGKNALNYARAKHWQPIIQLLEVAGAVD